MEKKMKNSMLKFIFLLIILPFALNGASGQPSSNGDGDGIREEKGLDLFSVAELFREAESLEKFEQALNDSENGINNLDLNENGEVDFIRVTETVSGDTHLIVLQSALGEDDYQDVAAIAVERENDEQYNLHVQGDETLYGVNYYVAPANNNFRTWNIVRWLFRPNYRAYVSPFGYGNYPRWWRVSRPVAIEVYRNRAALLSGRNNYVYANTVRVKNVSKIGYRRRVSTSVTKRKTRITTKVVNPQNDNQVRKTRTVVTTTRRKRN